MEEKKISIIVPIYNGEKKLRKCVDSILNQTYKNIEIILINDGSTDNTLNICNEYKNKNKSVMVINQKNSGVSIARNNGIKIATGEYIGFVDSDDYIEKNMYEIMYKNMIDDKVNIVACNLIYETIDKKIVKEFNHNDYIINRNEYPYEIYYNQAMQGYVCNKLYKKNLFNTKEELFKKNITILEDDLFNFQLFKNNKKIKVKFINDKLYHYVLNNQSASSSIFNIKKLSYLDVREEEINILNFEKMPNEHLKIDYMVSFKKMQFFAKKKKLYQKEFFHKYNCVFKKYSKNIDFKSLSNKNKLKFILIKYFTKLYHLKIILTKEQY